jgi:hypothetical protein
MATTLLGQSWMPMTRDAEGHREYKLVSRIVGAVTDGPFTALQTPGLFLPGAPWSFGSESDPWAFCRPDATVSPLAGKEPNTEFEVEQTFSTKPIRKCQDETFQDPLLEPAEISGSFVKYSEEATHNRFGALILNSSYEQMRGPQVEFDRNRPTIRIKQNVASPYLAYVLPARMIDTVNMFPIWGLPVRCVKLSGVSWTRKFHGLCYLYYERVLEFDINYETFDRVILDEGTKVLNGHWNAGRWVLDNVDGSSPSRWQPSHFIRFTDPQGNPCRVILNGAGMPSGVRITGRVTIPPTASDRSGVRRSAAEVAQIASNLALALDALQPRIDALHAQGTVLDTDLAVSSLRQARLLATTYNRLARRASGAAGGSGATAAAEAAYQAAQDLSAQVELCKGFFITVMTRNDSVAIDGQATVNECIELALQAGRIAANAEAGMSGSFDLVNIAREVDATADTGTGTFLTSDITPPGSIFVQKYNESNFILLGVPLIF